MTSREEIARLVDEELARANEIYPPFRSAHEGYAVTLEELEEMMEEIEKASEDIKTMWNRIKMDKEEGAIVSASRAYNRMLNAIAEAIQVAAMLKKMNTVRHDERS